MQASIDIRNGLLTREEGFALIREYDPQRPEALDYYLKITGQSEEEFYEAMKKNRVPALKNVKLPIIQKRHKNAERILPFPQQLIRKHKKQSIIAKV
ncbi:MAG: hypothetical protein HYS15_03725 [Candidatus Spechtbacteria bacterium]|nr:hypothetical protein [Candidatus Spechtbacteria bacterium]